MTHPLDLSIIELLRASQDDEHTIGVVVIRDRAFGFHAQQAIEKLLKALIAAHDVTYKFTHDLESLFEKLETLGERLPISLGEVLTLTDYAGLFRYFGSEVLGVDDRASVQVTVSTLRLYTMERIKILRPGVDWDAAV